MNKEKLIIISILGILLIAGIAASISFQKEAERVPEEITVGAPNDVAVLRADLMTMMMALERSGVVSIKDNQLNPTPIVDAIEQLNKRIEVLEQYGNP